MAAVKWIKIVTDIFDDEKMLLIESMPEADGIIVIWFKLLCMAGKQNNSGVLMLNDRIAYTDEMLATIFRRPVNTVRLALRTFEQYGMIEIVDSVITIPNWEKHQSLDKLERDKELNRKRVAAHRERQKQLAAGQSPCNDYCNGDVMPSNGTEENRTEEEQEKNKNRDRIDYQQIVDMYNDTCVSFPRLVSLSDNRKKAIKARMNTYTLEQFQTLFDKAEASNFLKGGNDRNWTATFDWLMKDSNFAKVLEGNYDNRQTAIPRQQPQQRNGGNIFLDMAKEEGIF